MALLKEAMRAWTSFSVTDNTTSNDLADKIYVFGYSLSSMALLISTFIFLYFRSLKKLKNQIHLNLFISLMFANLFWLTRKAIVVRNGPFEEPYAIWCKLLNVLMYGFMTSSYMWMFCESLNVHFNMVLVFVDNKFSIHLYSIIAWGTSIAVTLLYVIVRAFVLEDRDRCWTNWSNALWIFICQISINVAVSIGILSNTVVIVVRKLRNESIHSRSYITKKAFYTIFTMAPLFGIQVVLIPIPFSSTSVIAYIYQLTAALINSVQGFVVALIYCYCNEEVIATVKRRIARTHRINEAIALNTQRSNRRQQDNITIEVAGDTL